MPKPMPQITQKQLALFFSKFNVKSEEDCWPWLGTIRDLRLKILTPILSIDGVKFIASRISYFVFKEKDPGSFLVCHKCNYRLCVNPNHLYLGTYKDNYADMIKAGTTSIIHEGKLSDTERRELLHGEVCELARKFHISSSTIYYWRNKMAQVSVNLGPK